MKSNLIQIVLLLPLLTLLAGCEPSEPDPAKAVTSTDSAQLTSLFQGEISGDRMEVGALLANPPVGSVVAVEGKIGGSVSPFGEGYALFFLADEDLLFCNEMGDDHCETPWDACCEDAARIQQNRVLVRFSDEAGQVMPGNLKGVNGLGEMDRVVVMGTVVPADAGGIVIEGSRLERIRAANAEAPSPPM